MQNNLSTSNFNYIIKRIISIVVLLTVIVYLFGRYVKIVQYPRDSFYDFYNYIEKDAIDVLCVGSSHVYCGINPVQMYDDYGIAAFDLSVGGQAIWHSFYYISEALKTQNPKVVILDIFTLRVEDDDYFNDNTTQSNLLNMKASYDKWKAIQAANVERGGAEIFFGFPITHSRYKQLGRGSFNLEINNISHLGYSYQAKIVPYGEGEVRDVRGIKEKIAISEKAEEYLRRCIELCQKEGINIILVNSPMPTTPDEAQKKYNYVQQIADEYGVPFLNGVCFDEEMGLDWMVDSMGSDGHLNYHGATKYTKWLCDYMESNYDLPDRRGDDRFEAWSQASDKLKAVMRRDNIRGTVDINEYLDSINSKGLYYVVSLNGDYAKEDGKAVLDALLNHGIDIGRNGTYVMKDIEQLFYSNGESGYKFYKYFDDSVLYVYEEENNHVILWNGVENVAVKNGINIFVYDEILDEVVGKIGFNADADYEVVR